MSSNGKDVLQVSAKELLTRPKFVCSASYVRSEVYEPENGLVQYRVHFDFVGGQLILPVADESSLNPVGVSVGDIVQLRGVVDYNSYDGSVRLVPDFYSSTPAEIMPFLIFGYGEVVAKDVTKFNKESYYKAALRFSGGLHLFNRLTPQIYSRIPAKGTSVKFQCGLQTLLSRSREGNTVQKFGLELQDMTPVIFVSSPVKPVSTSPAKAS
jgi:hypothetical protein